MMEDFEGVNPSEQPKLSLGFVTRAIEAEMADPRKDWLSLITQELNGLGLPIVRTELSEGLFV